MVRYGNDVIIWGRYVRLIAASALGGHRNICGAQTRMKSLNNLHNNRLDRR